MVIDTSALVAALTEADGSRFLDAMERAGPLAISAVNFYETRLVLTGRRRQGVVPDLALVTRLGELVAQTGMAIVPFDTDQAILAHQAYLRFGKGFHPAALNFADCAAYALAKLRDEPLLFKGSDFAQTDIRAAPS